MSACPLVVLACESLHVYTVCIWGCEHARFCVEVFYALYINFHSFIHVLSTTRSTSSGSLGCQVASRSQWRVYPSSAWTAEIHHWRELPQVWFLSRQNASFVATKICLSQQNVCRDKSFVATSILFPDKRRVCRDKPFVATKIILVAAPANYRDGATSVSSPPLASLHSPHPPTRPPPTHPPPTIRLSW